MNIPSYKNKTFIIKDNNALIRKDDLSSAGKNFPNGTEIIITDTKVDNNRNLYVFAHTGFPKSGCSFRLD